MCLQLTGAVISLTGGKDAPGDLPLVVRLCRGEAHAVAQARLRDVLANVGADPGLDVGAAIGALLATAVDLVVRFDQYRAYPWRLVELCRRWSPDSYLTGALAFL